MKNVDEIISLWGGFGFLRYYFMRFVEFLNFIRSFLIKEYIFYPKYYLYENYFVSIKNFKMQQS